MASFLLPKWVRMQKGFPTDAGVTLESLSFGGQEAPSLAENPMVLSCGGVFLQRRELPTAIEKWRPIIHTRSREITARIFEMANKDPFHLFHDIISRGMLN